MYRRSFIGISLVVALVAAILGIWMSQKSSLKPAGSPLTKTINIAVVPPSFTTYTIFVAFNKKYFNDEGLEPYLRTFYPHGKAVLKAVSDGKADFGASSETPFMHAVLNGRQVYTIATTVTAERHLALVGRKDRDIHAPRDLRGKTIGATIGSNGEYFMETVLTLHKIPRDTVRVVHLKPRQMFDALMNGKVDAIATWNPHIHRVQKQLGDRGVTFTSESLYVPSFIISARQDFVKSNPEIVNRFLKALVRASEFIRAYPGESSAIVAQYFKIDKELIDELSTLYDFKVALDQAFLLILENQAEWAINRQVTDKTNLPNFLNYLHLDALTAVKAENVSVIR